MSKVTTNPTIEQENLLFSFQETISGKKVRADFNAPDLSSNGGLIFFESMKGSIAEKIGNLIPDYRNPFFIVHTYRDMVCQRVAQIACGYEDANDCNILRKDSSVKMAIGKSPSDGIDLCSQPTMTRLENNISTRTLYEIGMLFLKEFVASYDNAPKRVLLDVDDSNANTYGDQELTLFNAYYDEHCYMPMLMFDGLTGKMILPLLRPGRRNKSLNVFGILRRVVDYLHEQWPETIIELRGDSHFCCHQFMEWAHDKWYVRYTTGLSGNQTLLNMVAEHRKKAEEDFKISGEPVCRFYDFMYKASSWAYEQRVVAKIEVSNLGTNIRFVVTKNKTNKAETVYRRYCGRGTMELWVKDLKYLNADRMSCHKFRANYFRLFLYAAAYVMMHKVKMHLFRGTDIAHFTMDTFMKNIMLSAVFIREKKTFIQISFSPKHRHLPEMELAMKRMSA